MEDLNLLRAEFCNANTRIAGVTLKQSSGTLPTEKSASKELRLMRFSFGTSYRLSKASANASALPGGNGNSNGSFNNVGKNGNWWSATENNANNAYNRNINYNNANVNRNNNDKNNLYSVRCVQDCFPICTNSGAELCQISFLCGDLARVNKVVGKYGRREYGFFY